MKFLKEAALSGNEDAMLKLSEEYFLGKNVERDNLKGYAWLREASSRGNKIADEKICEFIEKGCPDMGLKENKNLGSIIRAEKNKLIN